MNQHQTIQTLLQYQEMYEKIYHNDDDDAFDIFLKNIKDPVREAFVTIHNMRCDRQHHLNEEINTRREAMGNIRGVVGRYGDNPIGLIIAKNEEKTIGQAINSMTPFTSEVFVLDTGSEDSTVKVAKETGDATTVIEEDWSGKAWHFSDARNSLLSKVPRGKKVIWLDADEMIFYGDPGSVVGNDINTVGNVITVQDDNGNWHETAMTAELRCHPNNEDIRFEGRVHNVLTAKDGGYKIRPSNILYRHFVKADPDKEARRLERTQGMLERELYDIKTSNPCFRNYHMACKTAMQCQDLDTSYRMAVEGLDMYKELPNTDRYHLQEFLMLGTHICYLMFERSSVMGRKNDAKKYIDKIPDFLGRHERLVKDCADNNFYRHCLHMEHGEYREAYDTALAYLLLVEKERKEPFWITNSLRFYDKMVLRFELLEIVYKSQG